jgi:DNA repair protein RadA/Sms
MIRAQLSEESGMAKAKRMYGCTECGATFPKWAGQCGECGAWNTLVETLLEANAATPSGRSGWAGEQAQIKTLAEVSVEEVPRFSTASGELDRVLGGGLVDGSVVLIGGDPGIGKSTILLQTLCNIATRFPALYVTGEESQQQVAMRARRLEGWLYCQNKADAKPIPERHRRQMRLRASNRPERDIRLRQWDSSKSSKTSRIPMVIATRPA